jgi:hypothetical protein
MFQADAFQNDAFQVDSVYIRAVRIFGNDGDSIARAQLSAAGRGDATKPGTTADNNDITRAQLGPRGRGDVIGPGSSPGVSGDGRIPIIIIRD